MSAICYGPGEGEVHEMGPNTIAIKATSEDTAGKFFLSESTIAPGFPGPPPHVHDEAHDMFYVLEGELTIRLGDEESAAGPGTFVCVPPGTVHTFSNRSDEPVRFLNFNAPGGWEGLHARPRRGRRERHASDAGGDRPHREPLRLPAGLAASGLTSPHVMTM